MALHNLEECINAWMKAAEEDYSNEKFDFKIEGIEYSKEKRIGLPGMNHSCIILYSYNNLK
jgi:hypothetical protein